MKPDSRKERSAMGNRTLLSILFGLLLVSTALFGQGSDWQYANVFNVVEGDYGPWIPSWYRTDFSEVTSFTPATPSLRTAFMRTPAGDDEMPVPVNHDQVVLRMDLLSGTEDIELRGVTVTLWGSPDFDPNEDLAPAHPDSAKDLYCETDTTKHSFTGFQFYIEKGLAAGSNVDSLDARDIYGIPEVLLINPDVIEVGTPPTTVDIIPAYLWEDVTGTTGHTSPYASWKEWRITFDFKDGIRIPYEATHRTDLYGLPFYRIWVVMKPVGCHECAESSRDGMMIEGLSNRDSLYVEIHDTEDLFIYKYLGVDPVSGIEIVDTIDMSISRDEVRWNTPDPADPEAQRWASSELLIGGDTIPPFITDLIPRNEVLSNGDETDFIDAGVLVDYA